MTAATRPARPFQDVVWIARCTIDVNSRPVLTKHFIGDRAGMVDEADEVLKPEEQAHLAPTVDVVHPAHGKHDAIGINYIAKINLSVRGEFDRVHAHSPSLAVPPAKVAEAGEAASLPGGGRRA